MGITFFFLHSLYERRKSQVKGITQGTNTRKQKSLGDKLRDCLQLHLEKSYIYFYIKDK